MSSNFKKPVGEIAITQSGINASKLDEVVRKWQLDASLVDKTKAALQDYITSVRQDDAETGMRNAINVAARNLRKVLQNAEQANLAVEERKRLKGVRDTLLQYNAPHGKRGRTAFKFLPHLFGRLEEVYLELDVGNVTLTKLNRAKIRVISGAAILLMMFYIALRAK